LASRYVNDFRRKWIESSWSDAASVRSDNAAAGVSAESADVASVPADSADVASGPADSADVASGPADSADAGSVGHGAGEPVLGTADIQSLADLANSFDVVREMRLMPIGRQAVVQLAIMLALPLLPLTLTMIPLEELIDRAVGVFF
jgi:hypothetical protein